MFAQSLFARDAVFHEADPQKRGLHALQELFQQGINGVHLARHGIIVTGPGEITRRIQFLF